MKKISSIILVFTSILMLLFLVTSCENSGSINSDHTHNYSEEWTTDAEPTCRELGSKSHHCLTCGSKNDITSIPATGHTFGEWSTTTEPTETTLGIKERECSVCHYKETETLPILPHTHNYSEEWTVDVEPTCRELGSKSHHCLTCGSKKDITSIPANGHTFVEWTTTTEPTETTLGTKQRECRVCHYKESETLPILPHTHNYSEEWTVDVEPTCRESGSKSHHCLTCGSKKDITVLEALGHNYVNEVCTRCGQNFGTSVLIFELDSTGNSYFVKSIGNSVETDIVIPSTYNGKPVIGIGDYAFYGCVFLSSITIPESITSIGKSAFENCKSLTSITLPFVGASLNETSNDHFGYIFGASSYSENSTYVPSSLKEVIITGGDSIAQYAFSKCSSLTSITIPNSVTIIRPRAFSECSSLTTVSIPNSVTSIGSRAFYNCSSLITVSIPDSITTLVSDAFDGCSNLAYNEYDNGYYLGNEQNPYVVIMKAKTTSITSFEINSSTKFIGSDAFSGCGNLTSITIPNSVTSIGSYAFQDCTNLTSLTIPDSVTSIENRAFAGCSSLQYNEYDYGQYLGNKGNPYIVLVRAKSTDITSCEINSSTKFIYSEAFSGCSNINNVNYEGTIEDWCNIQFMDKYSNPMYYGDHFYIRNNNEWEEVTSIEIPNTIARIGAYAFFGFNNVISITILNSVTSIGSYAFSECSNLTSITIPNSVTSIKNLAFDGCTSLKNIYYEGTASEWATIRILSSNEFLTSAKRYYYSETKPTDTTNSYWYYDENKNICIWE